nr:hypothetical protein [Methanobacterium formicicum]
MYELIHPDDQEKVRQTIKKINQCHRRFEGGEQVKNCRREIYMD